MPTNPPVTRKTDYVIQISELRLLRLTFWHSITVFRTPCVLCLLAQTAKLFLSFHKAEDLKVINMLIKPDSLPLV